MTGRGRPVRFLALVALGWIGMRFALLWSQTGSLPEAVEAMVPLASAEPGAGAVAAPQARSVTPVREARIVPAVRAGKTPAARAAFPESDPARVQMALLALVQYGTPATDGATVGVASVPLPPAAQPERLPGMPARWSASAWFVVRPGTGLGAAPGGSQLGGGQAGLRVAWLLAPRQRIAAFARAVTPLRGRGAEGSIGFEWQPAEAPVRLVAERRFGLDGARGGPGIGVIAGYDGTIAGLRLESYGQAGAIRRARTELYADGAVRATRTLAEGDAARLDLGPSAMVALQLAGQDVRLALDWRQRIAGNARPGSGFALTLGSDF